jgi:hypothetical protein
MGQDVRMPECMVWNIKKGKVASAFLWFANFYEE